MPRTFLAAFNVIRVKCATLGRFIVLNEVMSGLLNLDSYNTIKRLPHGTAITTDSSRMIAKSNVADLRQSETNLLMLSIV